MSGLQPRGITNYLSQLVAYLRNEQKQSCLLLNAGTGEILTDWTKNQPFPTFVEWSPNEQ